MKNNNRERILQIIEGIDNFKKEILAEQGIKCKVNPVTTEEYIEMMKITQAKRPFNSQMSKNKLLEQVKEEMIEKEAEKQDETADKIIVDIKLTICNFFCKYHICINLLVYKRKMLYLRRTMN